MNLEPGEIGVRVGQKQALRVFVSSSAGGVTLTGGEWLEAWDLLCKTKARQADDAQRARRETEDKALIELRADIQAALHLVRQASRPVPPPPLLNGRFVFLLICLALTAGLVIGMELL